LDISAASFHHVKPAELQVRCLLGSGAQADVFKAEWTRVFSSSTSSIVVAVKRLRRVDDVCREREAMALHMDHPNVVKCFDYTTVPPYLIVSEFCAGGSLFDALYASSLQLSIRQRVKILVDVASGMRYLHAQKPSIIHRDLKSPNVLLTKHIRARDQEPVAKVSDFGLSRFSSDQKASSTGSSNSRAYTMGVGTWRWMAPEMFFASDTNDYDESVDVYSFGIVSYEVLAQKVPYANEFPDLKDADPRMGLRVLDGLRPDVSELNPKFPSVLTEVMKKCWDDDPPLRPTFEELEPIMADLYTSLSAAASKPTGGSASQDDAAYFV
jgi:serine/threonine protein kinase